MNLLIPMLLAASLMVAPAAFAQGLPAASSATIPLKGAGFFGATANMEAEVFKPAGAGPFPVMVYAHGRSGTPQERLALREVIPRQYLEFWVARGFAAVGVARPGYGRTSGIDREIPGHTWESSGRCGGSFNPDRVAEAAGTAILATIDWVRQQAWAKAGALVVTGNSVGGMTAVLVGSRAPEGVLAVINFAGGVGGNPSIAPGRSCSPEKLTALFGKLGASSRLPSLWLYAPNDLFWGPEMPKTWYAAFTDAGAQASALMVTSPLPAPDGHDLIFVGRPLWEPHVDGFLKSLGL